MSAYTTQAKVESYLQRTLTASEVAILPLAISYISDVINSFTNRNWLDAYDEGDEEAEAPELPAASSRTYDGNDRKELPIDDAASVTKIELLDSLGGILLTIDDVDDFVVYPQNGGTIESLYLRSYHYPGGVARVRVTGVFTSGQVPDSVVMVATILVGKFLAQAPASSAGFVQESIEGYSYRLKSGAETDMETKMLIQSLGQYKKYTL